MAKNTWTTRDLDFLVANHLAMSTSDLAAHFGKSVAAVKQKRSKLGLKKPPVSPGTPYGRWVTLGEPFLVHYQAKQRESVVVCQCSCAAKTIDVVRLATLKSGHTQSCGCLFREMALTAATKHGFQSQNPALYQVFYAMNDRCYNKDNAAYADYGGRGIGVCPEWNPAHVSMSDALASFMSWAVESGWQRGLTLDRERNNEGYSPGNCRWADYQAQANNRRSNRRITAFGETRTLTEWSRDDRCAVGLQTLKTRLAGYDRWTEVEVELAISTPRGQYRGASPMPQRNYRAAHAAVAREVASGRLVRPELCQHPGCDKSPDHAHHHNGYDKPHRLDVVWLCAKHHLIADRSI